MTQETQCSHHWIIDAAEGATSKGVCQFCGAVRMFSNSIDVDAWPTQGRRGRPPGRAPGGEETHETRDAEVV